MLEIDEVLVDEADWAAMVAGDYAAKSRIQKAIDGVYLYLHALYWPGGPTKVVTLRDLEAHNVIEGVRIDVGMYGAKRDIRRPHLCI